MTNRALVVLAAALHVAAPALAQDAAEPPESPTAEAPAQAAKASRPPPSPLPKLPYQSLLKKDAEGKVIPLTEPVTWAACRVNPTLSAEDRARLEPVMAARKSECEDIVLRNLDLVESIDAGVLEKIDGDARHVMKTVGDYVKPLRPSGGART